jgi:hypothetical protein
MKVGGDRALDRIAQNGHTFDFCERVRVDFAQE